MAILIRPSQTATTSSSRNRSADAAERTLAWAVILLSAAQLLQLHLQSAHAQHLWQVHQGGWRAQVAKDIDAASSPFMVLPACGRIAGRPARRVCA